MTWFDEMEGSVRTDRRPTRVLALGAIAALVVTSAACSDSDDLKDQSMCAAYADYLEDLAAVQALDPEATSARKAANVAEAYLNAIRRLQEVADSRYTAQLNTLEFAVSEVLWTLEGVEEDEDYSTWAPLIEDSYEDAADAAVTVEDLFEAQCPSPGDEG
jgi:hypothetical protein